jgi:hypothetical protein
MNPFSEENRPRWRQITQGGVLWLFAIGLTLIMTLILSFNIVRPSTVSVTVGRPAANDIFAPRSANYISAILTEQAREQARAGVPDQYTPLDLSIGRSQLSWARAVFNFIDVVRADTSASAETKLSYLQAIDGLTISEEVGRDLITLESAEYAEAQEAVLTTIEELMTQEIRPNQLSDFRRLARRSSLVMTPAQDNIVTNLAYQFIVETVFLNEEATAQSREEAATEVEPVTRTISEGQRIIRAGDIVTEVDVEMLEQLGLLQAETDWRDVGSIFMASSLAVVFITLYWQQFPVRFYRPGRDLFVLAMIIIVFTLIAKLIVSGPAFLAYWYPIAAMSMLLAVIFDRRLAVTVTVVMAGLFGFIAPNSLELALYVAAGGLLSVFRLHAPQRLNAFFRAGLSASLGHTFIILMFQLPQNNDIVNVLQQLLYGFGNGILSAALTLAAFFLTGGVFGVLTIMQLQELSRLDHPLLQELLRKAPGTYHHSIMVANLAEQAAERLPEVNSSLVRVGAFYHDIGKMKRPPFFTENQEGINPHDKLDPYSSARIIISHVSDGLEFARKYRLPARIRDFIAEHHGNSLVRGFYMKALEQSGGDEEKLEKEKFRYRGPRPRTRETGLVLLADSVDATSNAVRPNTEKAIEKLVNTIVDEYVTDGQLNDSGLTLGDVQVIRTSFIDTLKGRFHIRVKYPGNEELAVDNLPDGGPPIREETPADERGAGSDGADANGDAPVAAEPDAETQEAA